MREEDLSFREAHHLVAETVKAADGDDRPEQITDLLIQIAARELGRPLRTSRDTLRLALDPDHFVSIRKIAGGPAPEAVAAQLADAQREQMQLEGWRRSKLALLGEYRILLRSGMVAAGI